jgi:hypothetical protein
MVMQGMQGTQADTPQEMRTTLDAETASAQRLRNAQVIADRTLHKPPLYGAGGLLQGTEATPTPTAVDQPSVAQGGAQSTSAGSLAGNINQPVQTPAAMPNMSLPAIEGSGEMGMERAKTAKLGKKWLEIVAPGNVDHTREPNMGGSHHERGEKAAGANGMGSTPSVEGFGPVGRVLAANGDLTLPVEGENDVSPRETEKNAGAPGPIPQQTPSTAGTTYQAAGNPDPNLQGLQDQAAGFVNPGTRFQFPQQWQGPPQNTNMQFGRGLGVNALANTFGTGGLQGTSSQEMAQAQRGGSEMLSLASSQSWADTVDRLAHQWANSEKQAFLPPQAYARRMPKPRPRPRPRRSGLLSRGRKKFRQSVGAKPGVSTPVALARHMAGTKGHSVIGPQLGQVSTVGGWIPGLRKSQTLGTGRNVATGLFAPEMPGLIRPHGMQRGGWIGMKPGSRPFDKSRQLAGRVLQHTPKAGLAYGTYSGGKAVMHDIPQEMAANIAWQMHGEKGYYSPEFQPLRDEIAKNIKAQYPAIGKDLALGLVGKGEDTPMAHAARSAIWQQIAQSTGRNLRNPTGGGKLLGATTPGGLTSRGVEYAIGSMLPEEIAEDMKGIVAEYGPDVFSDPEGTQKSIYHKAMINTLSVPQDEYAQALTRQLYQQAKPAAQAAETTRRGVNALLKRVGFETQLPESKMLSEERIAPGAKILAEALYQPEQFAKEHPTTWRWMREQLMDYRKEQWTPGAYQAQTGGRSVTNPLQMARKFTQLPEIYAAETTRPEMLADVASTAKRLNVPGAQEIAGAKPVFENPFTTQPGPTDAPTAASKALEAVKGRLPGGLEAAKSKLPLAAGVAAPVVARSKAAKVRSKRPKKSDKPRNWRHSWPRKPPDRPRSSSESKLRPQKSSSSNFERVVVSLQTLLSVLRHHHRPRWA